MYEDDVAMAGASNALRLAKTQFDEVRGRVYRAEAVLCGLHVLRYNASQFPGITGYSYYWEAEYDDEGSYYDSAYIRPIVEDENVVGHQEAIEKYGAPEEDYDNLDVWSKNACECLFGISEEFVSIEKLQERIAQLQKEI